MAVDAETTKQPGANPLFFGVLAALAVGGLAAVAAGDATVLHSNVIFRVAVGGAVAAVAYLAVVALWLAWHRKSFKKLGFWGGAVEADDAPIADDVRQRDLEVAEFMGTTTKALEELGRRVEQLEQNRG